VIGIQCACGRFLARPRATADSEGEGYSWHMFLADVRGDCSRCGLDVQASRSGWWWSWDAWKWPAGLEAA
jgi:hypothetical protein